MTSRLRYIPALHQLCLMDVLLSKTLLTLEQGSMAGLGACAFKVTYEDTCQLCNTNTWAFLTATLYSCQIQIHEPVELANWTSYYLITCNKIMSDPGNTSPTKLALVALLTPHMKASSSSSSEPCYRWSSSKRWSPPLYRRLCPLLRMQLIPRWQIPYNHEVSFLL